MQFKSYLKVLSEPLFQRRPIYRQMGDTKDTLLYWGESVLPWKPLLRGCRSESRSVMPIQTNVPPLIFGGKVVVKVSIVA